MNKKICFEFTQLDTEELGCNPEMGDRIFLEDLTVSVNGLDQHQPNMEVMGKHLIAYLQEVYPDKTIYLEHFFIVE